MAKRRRKRTPPPVMHDPNSPTRSVHLIALVPRPDESVGWALVKVNLTARANNPVPWPDNLSEADGVSVIEVHSFGRGVPLDPDAADPLEWSTDQALEALGDPRRKANQRADYDAPWGRLDEAPALPGTTGMASLQTWVGTALEQMLEALPVNDMAMFIVDGEGNELGTFEQLEGTPHFAHLEP